MVKTILFDLDGTLLPMDMDVFFKTYLDTLAQRMASYGYESKQLVKGVLAGTDAMLKNDGHASNETVFWEIFSSIFGERVRDDLPYFDAFYREDFDRISAVCGKNPKAAETVAELKRRGYRLILATNPVFPAVATEARIRWAGLSSEDFELYTTYENSAYCKPNPDYYRELLGKIGCRAEECLMVGNDTSDDIAAEQAGLSVFLLTNCLVNKQGKDITAYPQGDFDALLAYLTAQEK